MSYQELKKEVLEKLLLIENNIKKQSLNNTSAAILIDINDQLDDILLIWDKDMQIPQSLINKFKPD